ncbi:RusA family crossover junction endodeoxyribonuclease [Actinoplanes sp. NPDC051513]|uniref:RusA family crossover junction endodeoxyribonuclease n=1 Tax=Actinoplanes sp. NPDC051513 TaxID=3363908 RepID=UPI0037A59E85
MTAVLEHPEKRLSEIGDESICWQLGRELYDPWVVARLSLDGEPASKARARFTGYGSKKRAYTPAKTVQAEERIAWEFRRVRPGWQVDSDSHFGVIAVFFAGGYQRRDVDNMTKLVLDALNKIVWKDDVQVSEISARIVRGDPAPRTEIALYRTVAVNPAPTKHCEQCNAEFPVHRSTAAKRFCSRACVSAHRSANRLRNCEGCGKQFEGGSQRKFCSIPCRANGMRVPLTCEHCEEEFTKPKSLVRYGRAFCSEACKVAYWRAHRTAAAKGVCSVCGAPTSKKTYEKCRGCSTAARLGIAVSVE